LLERYAGQLMPRSGEWESRWWSPIINAEHLAMRESAALIDLSAFAILDVDGPGALAAVQHVAGSRSWTCRSVRVVYTSLLDDAGGFRADLTIMRLGCRQIPGGDRGRHRDDGPEVDPRPPAGSGAASRGVGDRRDLGVDDARAVGAEGAGSARASRVGGYRA